MLILNVIVIIIGLPLLIVLFTETNYEQLNTAFISYSVLAMVILLIFNLFFILSFNVKKFDDQKHLRLVEWRWNKATSMLYKSIEELKVNIRKTILEEVVKQSEDIDFKK
jgi:amino acid transporter